MRRDDNSLVPSGTPPWPSVFRASTFPKAEVRCRCQSCLSGRGGRFRFRTRDDQDMGTDTPKTTTAPAKKVGTTSTSSSGDSKASIWSSLTAEGGISLFPRLLSQRVRSGWLSGGGLPPPAPFAVPHLLGLPSSPSAHRT